MSISGKPGFSTGRSLVRASCAVAAVFSLTFLLCACQESARRVTVSNYALDDLAAYHARTLRLDALDVRKDDHNISDRNFCVQRPLDCLRAVEDELNGILELSHSTLRSFDLDPGVLEHARDTASDAETEIAISCKDGIPKYVEKIEEYRRDSIQEITEYYASNSQCLGEPKPDRCGYDSFDTFGNYCKETQQLEDLVRLCGSARAVETHEDCESGPTAGSLEPWEFHKQAIVSGFKAAVMNLMTSPLSIQPRQAIRDRSAPLAGQLLHISGHVREQIQNVAALAYEAADVPLAHEGADEESTRPRRGNSPPPLAGVCGAKQKSINDVRSNVIQVMDSQIALSWYTLVDDPVSFFPSLPVGRADLTFSHEGLSLDKHIALRADVGLSGIGSESSDCGETRTIETLASTLSQAVNVRCNLEPAGPSKTAMHKPECSSQFSSGVMLRGISDLVGALERQAIWNASEIALSSLSVGRRQETRSRLHETRRPLVITGRSMLELSSGDHIDFDFDASDGDQRTENWRNSYRTALESSLEQAGWELTGSSDEEAFPQTVKVEFVESGSRPRITILISNREAQAPSLRKRTFFVDSGKLDLTGDQALPLHTLWVHLAGEERVMKELSKTPSNDISEVDGESSADLYDRDRALRGIAGLLRLEDAQHDELKALLAEFDGRFPRYCNVISLDRFVFLSARDKEGICESFGDEAIRRGDLKDAVVALEEERRQLKEARYVSYGLSDEYEIVDGRLVLPSQSRDICSLFVIQGRPEFKPEVVSQGIVDALLRRRTLDDYVPILAREILCEAELAHSCPAKVERRSWLERRWKNFERREPVGGMARYLDIDEIPNGFLPKFAAEEFRERARPFCENHSSPYTITARRDLVFRLVCDRGVLLRVQRIAIGTAQIDRHQHVSSALQDSVVLWPSVFESFKKSFEYATPARPSGMASCFGDQCRLENRIKDQMAWYVFSILKAIVSPGPLSITEVQEKAKDAVEKVTFKIPKAALAERLDMLTLQALVVAACDPMVRRCPTELLHDTREGLSEISWTEAPLQGPGLELVVRGYRKDRVRLTAEPKPIEPAGVEDEEDEQLSRSEPRPGIWMKLLSSFSLAAAYAQEGQGYEESRSSPLQQERSQAAPSRSGGECVIDYPDGMHEYAVARAAVVKDEVEDWFSLRFWRGFEAKNAVAKALLERRRALACHALKLADREKLQLSVSRANEREEQECNSYNHCSIPEDIFFGPQEYLYKYVETKELVAELRDDSEYQSGLAEEAEDDSKDKSDTRDGESGEDLFSPIPNPTLGQDAQNDDYRCREEPAPEAQTGSSHCVTAGLEAEVKRKAVKKLKVRLSDSYDIDEAVWSGLDITTEFFESGKGTQVVIGLTGGDGSVNLATHYRLEESDSLRDEFLNCGESAGNSPNSPSALETEPNEDNAQQAATETAVCTLLREVDRLDLTPLATRVRRYEEGLQAWLSERMPTRVFGFKPEIQPFGAQPFTCRARVKFSEESKQAVVDWTEERADGEEAVSCLNKVNLEALVGNIVGQSVRESMGRWGAVSPGSPGSNSAVYEVEAPARHLVFLAELGELGKQAAGESVPEDEQSIHPLVVRVVDAEESRLISSREYKVVADTTGWSKDFEEASEKFLCPESLEERRTCRLMVSLFSLDLTPTLLDIGRYRDHPVSLVEHLLLSGSVALPEESTAAAKAQSSLRLSIDCKALSCAVSTALADDGETALSGNRQRWSASVDQRELICPVGNGLGYKGVDCRAELWKQLDVHFRNQNGTELLLTECKKGQTNGSESAAHSVPCKETTILWHLTVEECRVPPIPATENDKAAGDSDLNKGVWKIERDLFEMILDRPGRFSCTELMPRRWKAHLRSRLVERFRDDRPDEPRMVNFSGSLEENFIERLEVSADRDSSGRFTKLTLALPDHRSTCQLGISSLECTTSDSEDSQCDNVDSCAFELLNQFSQQRLNALQNQLSRDVLFRECVIDGPNGEPATFFVSGDDCRIGSEPVRIPSNVAAMEERLPGFLRGKLQRSDFWAGGSLEGNLKAIVGGAYQVDCQSVRCVIKDGEKGDRVAILYLGRSDADLWGQLESALLTACSTGSRENSDIGADGPACEAMGALQELLGGRRIEVGSVHVCAEINARLRVLSDQLPNLNPEIIDCAAGEPLAVTLYGENHELDEVPGNVSAIGDFLQDVFDSDSMALPDVPAGLRTDQLCAWQWMAMLAGRDTGDQETALLKDIFDQICAKGLDVTQHDFLSELKQVAIEKLEQALLKEAGELGANLEELVPDDASSEIDPGTGIEAVEIEQLARRAAKAADFEPEQFCSDERDSKAGLRQCVFRTISESETVEFLRSESAYRAAFCQETSAALAQLLSGLSRWVKIDVNDASCSAALEVMTIEWPGRTSPFEIPDIGNPFVAAYLLIETEMLEPVADQLKDQIIERVSGLTCQTARTAVRELAHRSGLVIEIECTREEEALVLRLPPGETSCTITDFAAIHEEVASCFAGFSTEIQGQLRSELVEKVADRICDGLRRQTRPLFADLVTLGVFDELGVESCKQADDEQQGGKEQRVEIRLSYRVGQKSDVRTIGDLEDELERALGTIRTTMVDLLKSKFSHRLTEKINEQLPTGWKVKRAEEQYELHNERPDGTEQSWVLNLDHDIGDQILDLVESRAQDFAMEMANRELSRFGLPGTFNCTENGRCVLVWSGNIIDRLAIKQIKALLEDPERHLRQYAQRELEQWLTSSAIDWIGSLSKGYVEVGFDGKNVVISLGSASGLERCSKIRLALSDTAKLKSDLLAELLHCFTDEIPDISEKIAGYQISTHSAKMKVVNCELAASDNCQESNKNVFELEFDRLKTFVPLAIAVRALDRKIHLKLADSGMLIAFKLDGDSSENVMHEEKMEGLRVKGFLAALGRAHAIELAVGEGKISEKFTDALCQAREFNVAFLPSPVKVLCAVGQPQIEFVFLGETIRVLSGVRLSSEQGVPRLQIEGRLSFEPSPEQVVLKHLSSAFSDLKLDKVDLQQKLIIGSVHLPFIAMSHDPRSGWIPFEIGLSDGRLDSEAARGLIKSAMFCKAMEEASFRLPDALLPPNGGVKLTSRGSCVHGGQAFEQQFAIRITDDALVPGILIVSQDGGVTTELDFDALEEKAVEWVLEELGIGKLTDFLSSFGLAVVPPYFRSHDGAPEVLMQMELDPAFLEGTGFGAITAQFWAGENGIEFVGKFKTESDLWIDTGTFSFGDFGVGLDYTNKVFSLLGSATMSPGEVNSKVAIVDGEAMIPLDKLTGIGFTGSLKLLEAGQIGTVNACIGRSDEGPCLRDISPEQVWANLQLNGGSPSIPLLNLDAEVSAYSKLKPYALEAKSGLTFLGQRFVNGFLTFDKDFDGRLGVASDIAGIEVSLQAELLAMLLIYGAGFQFSIPDFAEVEGYSSLQSGIFARVKTMGIIEALPDLTIKAENFDELFSKIFELSLDLNLDLDLSNLETGEGDDEVAEDKNAAEDANPVKPRGREAQEFRLPEPRSYAGFIFNSPCLEQNRGECRYERDEECITLIGGELCKLLPGNKKEDWIPGWCSRSETEPAKCNAETKAVAQFFEEIRCNADTKYCKDESRSFLRRKRDIFIKLNNYAVGLGRGPTLLAVSRKGRGNGRREVRFFRTYGKAVGSAVHEAQQGCDNGKTGYVSIYDNDPVLADEKYSFSSFYVPYELGKCFPEEHKLVVVFPGNATSLPVAYRHSSGYLGEPARGGVKLDIGPLDSQGSQGPQVLDPSAHPAEGPHGSGQAQALLHAVADWGLVSKARQVTIQRLYQSPDEPISLLAAKTDQDEALAVLVAGNYSDILRGTAQNAVFRIVNNDRGSGDNPGVLTAPGFEIADFCEAREGGLRVRTDDVCGNALWIDGEGSLLLLANNTASEYRFEPYVAVIRKDSDNGYEMVSGEWRPTPAFSGLLDAPVVELCESSLKAYISAHSDGNPQIVIGPPGGDGGCSVEDSPGSLRFVGSDDDASCFHNGKRWFSRNQRVSEGDWGKFDSTYQLGERLPILSGPAMQEMKEEDRIQFALDGLLDDSWSSRESRLALQANPIGLFDAASNEDSEVKCLQ